MDPLLEQLLLPWWKIIAYFLALVVGVIGIRVSLKFDVNTWMEQRRKSKLLADQRRRAAKCGHVWTLYPSSVYSQCNFCLAYIQTSTLLVGQQLDVQPTIVGTNYAAVLNPTEGAIVATGYIGHRE